jgi:hypothetical protein
LAAPQPEGSRIYTALISAAGDDPPDSGMASALRWESAAATFFQGA